MILNNFHNNGIKTVLKSSAMMVLKSLMMVLKTFHSNGTKTVLKSSTIMILKSLKRFLNDGTKKVH